MANKVVLKEKYNVELKDFEEIKELSVAIVVVQHNFYRDAGVDSFLEKMQSKGVLMDVPNLFVTQKSHFKNIIYWNL